MSIKNKIDKDNDVRWKRKYRERAKDYIFKLSIIGIEPFSIDSSDLSKRVKKELDGLDYEAEEYVGKVVVGKIFDSIGERYLKLSVRDHVDWERSVAAKILHPMKSKERRSKIDAQDDVSNSVLVMDIQKRRAGPEYYARSLRRGGSE